MSQKLEEWSPLRRRLHEIIFEAETPAGKAFDIILLLAILMSVIVVMLETVPTYQLKYGPVFSLLEWIFTFIFVVEYALRIYCIHKPWKYVTSFFGIVDLMAILPTFLSLIFAGTQSLMIIRGLRLLRVFRIFKLAHFLSQGQIIITALKASRAKIFVFMIFILILVSIFGSMMYLIEGRSNAGFDSIPRSIYWAIVTLTTVGYGDISPQSSIGQFLASLIMIAGYSILAVPTGIVTGEIIKSTGRSFTESCPHCMKEGHAKTAKFCDNCGGVLNP